MKASLRFAAASSALAGLCACAHAGPPLPSLDTAEATPAPAAPVHGHLPFPFHHAAAERALSSRSPIAVLCANTQAKAVLDRDLPGLTTRPEFDMFKHFSLRTLQRMSRGQMSADDVAKVDADLKRLPLETDGGPTLQKVALSQ